MDLLERLNPQQRDAVERIDRHLLVVAGAGSGKTRVLTHKIAYLIQACDVPPSGVLAMTFSNQAAREMRERAQGLLPSFAQPYWVGTFHSTCLRLLKEFAADAGLTPPFTIYDESDQLAAVKRALADLNIDSKMLPPGGIRFHINRAKNETGDILRHLAGLGGLGERALKVVERYQAILRENNALDFGDLLTRAVDLLRNHSDVADQLRQRFPRILVDEYQDTNRVQKELLTLLAGSTGIVCAVGDEDQSIYGWRGARVENILEFEEDFPGSAVLKLERNYRSTKVILAATNHVIAHNTGRRGKTLWTENAEGELISFYLAEDDREEAAFVLNRVEELEGRKIPASEMAVFYRTHAQSRVLEEECRRRNRPYRIFGGTRFYDREEVKDTLAFLKVLVNPFDRVSFLRIVNKPSRGIGEKSVERLLAAATERGIQPLDAIPFLEGRGKAERALGDFRTWVMELREDLSQLSAWEIAEILLKKSGYRAALEREGTIESESKLENLEELLRSMEEAWEGREPGVAEYLDRISLVSDLDTYASSADSLTFMTVHNAKGLEFDGVFVVGMEEGLFPHQRSIESGRKEEIEEERRLCYVAMTRARTLLHLTSARRRRLHHTPLYNPISRFVGEIPAKFIEEMGAPQRTELDEYHDGTFSDELPPRWPGKKQASAVSSSPYQPGTRVLHPDFGMGTIRKCEGREENLKLTVSFPRVGTKKLLLNYAHLELVEP